MSAEYDKGWQDGYNFALNNFNPVTGYQVPFPSNFNHRGDMWSRGFAEGEIYGHGKVFDKFYIKKDKKLKSISWDLQQKKYIATYD